MLQVLQWRNDGVYHVLHRCNTNCRKVLQRLHIHFFFRLECRELNLNLQAIRMLRKQIEDAESKLCVIKDVAETVEISPEIISESSARIERLKDKLTAAQIDLISAIYETVTNQNARDVLIARYVRCEPFGTVSAALHLSESAIYKLHRQGVKQFTAAEKVYKSLHFERGE